MKLNNKDKEQMRKHGIVLTYGELYFIFAAKNHKEFMDRVWRIFTEHMEKIVNFHEVCGMEEENNETRNI